MIDLVQGQRNGSGQVRYSDSGGESNDEESRVIKALSTCGERYQETADC